MPSRPATSSFLSPRATSLAIRRSVLVRPSTINRRWQCGPGGFPGIDPGLPPDAPREVRRQLGARAHVQLLVDLGEVPLDGLRADEERIGNLLIRPAEGDLRGDPLLRRRELPVLRASTT